MKNHFVRLLTWSCCWAVVVCCSANPANAQIKTITLEKQAKVVASTISPDGKFVAGAVSLENGEKADTLEVRIWNIATGKIQDTFATRNIPYSSQSSPSLMYSSDGVWLAHANGDEKVIYLRNTKLKQTKKITLKKEERCRSLRFVPDSDTLVAYLDCSTYLEGTRKANDSSLTMWNVSTGNVIGKIKTYLPRIRSDPRYHYYVLKDSIVITDRSTLRSFDTRKFTKQHEIKTDLNLRKKQFGLIVMPDAERHSLLARYYNRYSSSQYEMEIWDLKSLKMISTFQSGKNQELWGLCFSPDGKSFAALIERTDKSTFFLSIREVATQKQIMTIDLGEVGFHYVFYLSPDMIMVHKNIFDGGTLNLWNLKTRKQYNTQIEIGNSDKKPFFVPRRVEVSRDLGIYLLGGANGYEFEPGSIFSTPRVFEGQIKIINLKAFLKKAAAEDKRKVK